MQSGFLQDKVLDHFTDASTVYACRKGVVHPEADPIIVDFISEMQTDANLGKVLEVGGGSGYLLGLLAEEIEAVQLINCELAYHVYRKQVNSSIVLVGGNALNLPFAESEFDYVIAKNLLHHLVGRTRRESKGFAQRAAIELRRVAKSRGYLIILEQYHQYDLCAAVLFYLTLLLSMGSFRLDALGIRPKVVVSFLALSELHELFERPCAGRDQVIMDRTKALPATSAIRLLPFLSRFGRLLFIKEVHK